jgi:mono/diheme cytochrome c family protein
MKPGKGAALAATIFAAQAGAALAQQGDAARGKYLVTIGVCESCHTPRDPKGNQIEGQRFSGGRQSGGLNVPNLTPDMETGLGKWSEADIVNALRSGTRPDGSKVRPPMGVFFYQGFSDRDAHAIAAYLKSLPPVGHKVERTPPKGPPPQWSPVEHVAETDRADRVAYGRYLAQTVSHCLQCHSPKGPNNLPDLSRAGLGGNTYVAPGGGTVVSANLTPGNPDGIAGWTDEQVKTAITKGVRPNGSRMVNQMDFDLYEQMTPDDLDMLVGFLRTLKPLTSEAK